MRKSEQAVESCIAQSTPTPEEGEESTLYNRRQQSLCESMGAGTNRSVAQPSRYVDSHSNRVYLLRPLLKSTVKTETTEDGKK